MTPAAQAHPGRSAVSSRLTLRLTPEPVSIAISRSTIRRLVTFRGDDAESSFLVAVTEIVANAIDEHVRLGISAPVELTIRYGPSDVVEVSDSGHGLGEQTEAPQVTDSDGYQLERGRGLALARAFVPDLTVVSGDDGTTATLPLVGFGIVR